MEAAGIELLWSIWIYIQNPVWLKDVCCVWICFEKTVDVVDRSENSFGLVSWLKVGKSHLSRRAVQFVPRRRSAASLAPTCRRFTHFSRYDIAFVSSGFVELKSHATLVLFRPFVLCHVVGDIKRQSRTQVTNVLDVYVRFVSQEQSRVVIIYTHFICSSLYVVGLQALSWLPVLVHRQAVDDDSFTFHWAWKPKSQLSEKNCVRFRAVFIALVQLKS